ncbi:protein Wnt-1-like isoform X2 [Acropora millepora]|uniref:protein Wnt-1-like isoform X2 n=1 Tax=Acropora millepora TaxID=45264 RepID=UPI001CF28E84|nr:protein Wnt-1-like isoform X2 [Acropora millepora]
MLSHLSEDDRQKHSPLLMSIAKAGANRGLAECQRLFKNEIWNCSVEDTRSHEGQLPIFIQRTLPSANRETAFLHAISSAAITYEITLQCARRKIPGCGCAETEKPSQVDNSNWKWGGCGDNIKFGKKVAKRFMDKLENGNDARTAFNLHNNEVGRRAVQAKLKRKCKCHGVSGSCNFKTCWKQLSTFEATGETLKRNYHTAEPVKFNNDKLQKQRKKRNRFVSSRDKHLVYLDSSPDYCVRNVTTGSPGMLGRACSSDTASLVKCRSLCSACNLRYRTVYRYKRIKCKCKFVWCCAVKCELCTVKYLLTTCE